MHICVNVLMPDIPTWCVDVWCHQGALQSSSYLLESATQALLLQPTTRADSSFASSQWETALLCNDVSHWLDANLESALHNTMWFIITLSNFSHISAYTHRRLRWFSARLQYLQYTSNGDNKPSKRTLPLACPRGCGMGHLRFQSLTSPALYLYYCYVVSNTCTVLCFTVLYSYICW